MCSGVCPADVGWAWAHLQSCGRRLRNPRHSDALVELGSGLACKAIGRLIDSEGGLKPTLQTRTIRTPRSALSSSRRPATASRRTAPSLTSSRPQDLTTPRPHDPASEVNSRQLSLLQYSATLREGINPSPTKSTVGEGFIPSRADFVSDVFASFAPLRFHCASRLWSTIKSSIAIPIAIPIARAGGAGKRYFAGASFGFCSSRISSMSLGGSRHSWASDLTHSFMVSGSASKLSTRQETRWMMVLPGPRKGGRSP